MGIALGIAGAVCILYGVMVMLVGSGTWFFAFWYALGAVLLVAAWAVLSGRWAALPAVLRHAVVGLAAALLVGFAATQALIMQDFNDKAEPGLDYLIVLGAQVRDSGPSIVLQYRLDAAFAYLEANPNTKCIVSGGRGPNEHASEASVMADYLIGRGINPKRIIREGASENTEQNIANSMALLDPDYDSVAIVTNNFHVFRGVGIARKAGISHVSGLATDSSVPFLPNNMVRESLSIAKDYVMGNL